MLGLFSQQIYSQRIPDPNNTYGPGTTTNTSTSTNPDTFIPETKTDYQDANGTTRQETIKTKDHDGNNVTKEKFYDKTGKLEKETESRTDPKTGRVVFSEEKKYGYGGKVIQASKFAHENGKYFFYDYDRVKQEYKDPRIVANIDNTNTNKEFFACNDSKMRLTLGYSYFKASKGNSFPIGVDLGIGFRLNKNFRFVTALSGHNSTDGDNSLTRIHATAGVEYKKEDCDKRPPISIFSRIAIGMMHDRIKSGESKSSGNAAIGSAGGGFDINIKPKMGVRLSGDYILAFINGNTQGGFRFGAGVNFYLGHK